MCTEIEHARLLIEALETDEESVDVEYITTAVENAFGSKYSVNYEYHDEDPVFVHFSSGPYNISVGYFAGDGELDSAFYGEYFNPETTANAIGESAFTLEELIVQLDALFQTDVGFQNRMQYVLPSMAGDYFRN